MGRSVFQEEGTAGAKVLRQQELGVLTECKKVPVAGARRTNRVPFLSRHHSHSFTCLSPDREHPTSEALLQGRQVPTLIFSQIPGLTCSSGTLLCPIKRQSLFPGPHRPPDVGEPADPSPRPSGLPATVSHILKQSQAGPSVLCLNSPLVESVIVRNGVLCHQVLGLLSQTHRHRVTLVNRDLSDKPIAVGWIGLRGLIWDPILANEK